MPPMVTYLAVEAVVGAGSLRELPIFAPTGTKLSSCFHTMPLPVCRRIPSSVRAQRESPRGKRRATKTLSSGLTSFQFAPPSWLTVKWSSAAIQSLLDLSISMEVRDDCEDSFCACHVAPPSLLRRDRKSTRLNSS